MIKRNDMYWEKGREQGRRKNTRVVTYVRHGMDVRVGKKIMEEDLISEVWLSVGEPGQKRFMVEALYREHKPWKQGKVGHKEGKTPAEQTDQRRRWPEVKADIL